MSVEAIHFEHVVMNFGKVQALDDISLQIEQGQVVGLLGHNGAGKTTSIKIILGILRPTSGSVKVFANDPTNVMKMAALRRQMGYLPENLSFYPQLSGRETLRYFARLKGAGKQEQEQLLEEVGLLHAADRRVKTYSKGMRQRLGLAQAMLNRPKLLILDEPTVGLDPVATRDLYDKIERLKQQGTTIILCSHVLSGIEEHLDRALILSAGKILAQGSIDELRKQAQLPMTIHVRGKIANQEWLDKLPSQGVLTRRINSHQYILSAAASYKLTLLTALASEKDVEDIEIVMPTLESIYIHYNTQPASGSEVPRKQVVTEDE